jgi:hypothetical protein
MDLHTAQKCMELRVLDSGVEHPVRAAAKLRMRAKVVKKATKPGGAVQLTLEQVKRPVRAAMTDAECKIITDLYLLSHCTKSKSYNVLEDVNERMMMEFGRDGYVLPNRRAAPRLIAKLAATGHGAIEKDYKLGKFSEPALRGMWSLATDVSAAVGSHKFANYILSSNGSTCCAHGRGRNVLTVKCSQRRDQWRSSGARRFARACP